MMHTSKSEETREHILTVAFELFLSKGYKEVTMSELEKTTGLTKGAFYHHFKDKMEIFQAAITEKIWKMRFKTDPAWIKQTSLKGFIDAIADHDEKIIKYIQGLRINYADLHFSNIANDVMNYIPNFKKTLIDIVEDEISMWEGIIFRAKENGEIRSDIDPAALSFTFMGINQSTQKSFFIGKSTQYTLSMIRLQYEQLYSLLKK